MQQLPIPPLAEGELYVCGLVDENGQVEHTIITAFSDEKYADHAATLAWAESIGGDLPTCVELAVMFAKLRDRFKKDAYWSKDISHWNTAYARYQGFNLGYQNITLKYGELCGVAVRRVKN